jgi:hypothetical protein
MRDVAFFLQDFVDRFEGAVSRLPLPMHLG